MNLIEDHQVTFMVREVADGIGELDALVLVLEVEVNRRPCRSDLQGKRGLARLSRSQQDDGGPMTESLKMNRLLSSV